MDGFPKFVTKIGRPDICHGYHELYSWTKNCLLEKFQLSMCDNCGKIENFSTCEKISVQLMGFYCISCHFVAKSVIHAALSWNFCRNLRAFMWRNFFPKVHLWRKMINIRYENRHNSLANFFWLHELAQSDIHGHKEEDREQKTGLSSQIVWKHLYMWQRRTTNYIGSADVNDDKNLFGFMKHQHSLTVGRRSRPPMVTANRKK